VILLQPAKGARPQASASSPSVSTRPILTRSEPSRALRAFREAGRNPVAVRRRRSPHVAALGLRAAQDRGDRSTRSGRDRRACEGNEMIGQKVPMSARWKRRRAPKPRGAREPPFPPNVPAPPILRIDEARMQVERTRVGRWVASRIVTWASDNCAHCRWPIVFGAKWVELVNDNDGARFHFDCAPMWRAPQEVSARRAMGLDRNRCAQQDPDGVCARVPQ
jgi:hypothetical protein